jgi:hypothetical protein
VGKEVPPELLVEQVIERLACNCIQAGNPFEGRLRVTERRRPVYLPKPVSVRRGAKPFDIPLEDVAEADVAPRGFNLNDKSRTSDVMTAVYQAASVLSAPTDGNRKVSPGNQNHRVKHLPGPHREPHNGKRTEA